VFVATGTGETITGARRSAYAAVKKVKIATNDCQYRLDIGRGRLIEQLATIQRLGFGTGLSY
jgi:phosphoribosylamine--glycine ligase